MKSGRYERETDFPSVGFFSFFFFYCGIWNRIPAFLGTCISPSSIHLALGSMPCNFGFLGLLQMIVFAGSIQLLISLGTL